MQVIDNLQVKPIPGIVETHCHLGDAYFDPDLDSVIERARLAGVAQMLTIGNDPEGIPKALDIAKKHADVRAVIGIHPLSADQWTDEIHAQIEDAITTYPGKLAALGEMGLDYHWDTDSRDLQKQVFEAQLSLASKHRLPIVIHCRDAFADMFDILEANNFKRAVVHCYTSNAADADQAIDLGLYLGLGGVLTHKKSEDLRSIAATLPRDRVLVETDCPYVPTQRWRGKRNEPACITEVVLTLAAIWGVEPSEAARITAENAKALFG